jgi:thiol-disulfide isomerase/thioredoxin
MRTIILVLLSAFLAFAQQEKPTDEEQLTQALQEAGNSPVDFIRAIEKYLKEHPLSPRKDELEDALVKAAIETRDDRRILLYGERVLARASTDVQVLDRVARALLSNGDPDSIARALKYARRWEEVVAGLRKQEPPAQARLNRAQWAEELDRNQGRALALQARATGGLGRLDEAVALARKSFEMFPSAEAAREIGHWLERSGKTEEAAARYADAFTISDVRNTDADRAADRAKMGELYRQAKGSEKGLGDVVLESWDRTTALVAARRQAIKSADPNAQATTPTEFTLSGLNGKKLSLASLKGKVVVIDFWATWCAPCRAQHPLYEQVKQRFRNKPDVIFLSVNTDDDHDLVPPFLKEHDWDQEVYFEDGLARVLKIASIPTTIVLAPSGEVSSRMNGYVPSRFVAMLIERIQDALGN